MKWIFLLLLVISTRSFAQQPVTRYIQLNAQVDALGNINVYGVEGPALKKDKKDTLVNYNAIRRVLQQYQKPIAVFNELAQNGWVLVSSAYIGKDEQGRPNAPFIVYYLRKEFDQH